MLVLNASLTLSAEHYSGQMPIRIDIGKREVVGHGLTGEETYVEDVHAPFPAIRFKEDVGEIAVGIGALKWRKYLLRDLCDKAIVVMS